MSDSSNNSGKIQIGYLGSECSFTCRAAKNFFRQHACSDFASLSSCKAIFQKVSSGELTYGVLPVESSNHGRFPLLSQAYVI
jgi:prephenate dehydratase